MKQNIAQVLNGVGVTPGREAYRLINLPIAALTAAAGVLAEIGEPFCSVTVDDHALTLVIPDAAWTDFKHRLPGAAVSPTCYSLITLENVPHTQASVVLSAAAQALSAADVGFFSLSASDCLHLLVVDNTETQALQALDRINA